MNKRQKKKLSYKSCDWVIHKSRTHRSTQKWFHKRFKHFRPSVGHCFRFIKSWMIEYVTDELSDYEKYTNTKYRTNISNSLRKNLLKEDQQTFPILTGIFR